MKTGQNNVRNSKIFNLASGDDFFLKNFGKIHKLWSLGLGLCDEVSFWNFKSRVSVSEFFIKPRSRRFYEVSVLKVTVSTTSLLFSVANAKRKHNRNWSVKYFILRIRFNKISPFRMLLKRLKLHRITTIFRWCGTHFFYTQAYKITPSGNTVR